MKRIFSLALLFVCLGLTAQTRQLPVVEILGEGQVIMPLAPRGPLPFQISEPVDSLPYFIPSSFPWHSASILPYYPPLRGSFSALFGTDWKIGLKSSLYDLHPMIPHARLDVSEELFPHSFDHQYYGIFAKISPDSIRGFDTLIRYHNSDADAYQSSSFAMEFRHEADSLRDRSWTLRRVKTRLWWENSSQLHAGSRDKHNVPGFWHSHELSVDRHRFENQIGISMGRLSFSTIYPLSYRFPGLKRFSGGFMSDFYHLLPRVEIHYEKLLVKELRLQAGNYPSLTPLSRTALMTDYPWAGQPRLGRAEMSPIDIRLQLERTLPAFFGLSPTHRDRAPQNSLSLIFNSAYIYSHPILRQAGSGSVPKLLLEPLWKNSLSGQARIRLPYGWLEQGLSLGLRHLPHQGNIRAPYMPLLTSSTAYRYREGRLEAAILLEQFYNREDHLGRNMQDFIDLSLEAAYQLCSRIMIKAEIQNLLGEKYILWRGLPERGREIRLGASYTWR